MRRDNYVGNKIKRFRTVRGLSQEKLALQAEINTAFLGHLERGLKVPTVTTLKKITDALGITLAEFFDDNLTSQSPDDSEKQGIIDTIVLTIRDLSVSQLTHVADAIHEIVKLCEK